MLHARAASSKILTLSVTTTEGLSRAHTSANQSHKIFCYNEGATCMRMSLKIMYFQQHLQVAQSLQWLPFGHFEQDEPQNIICNDANR